MILVAVPEQGGAEALSWLAALRPLDGVGMILAHVIDAGPRHGLALGRARAGGRPLPPHQLRSIGEAERTSALAVLEEASQVATAFGARASLVSVEGDPGPELVRLVRERQPDLLVVGAGRLPGQPGPHSLGRVARFAVDHSERPVLLLRGERSAAVGLTRAR